MDLINMANSSSTSISAPPLADANLSTPDPAPSSNASDFITKQELNDQLNLFSTKLLDSIKHMIPSTSSSSSTSQFTPSSSHLVTHNISDDNDSDIEEGEVEEEEGILSTMANCDEDKGPNISDTLSKGIDKIMSAGLKSERREDLHMKFMTPGYCDRLAVIKCNECIYRNASNSIRNTDSGLQNIQKGIVKGLIAAGHAHDMINSLGIPTSDEVVSVNTSDLKQLQNTLVESIAILADTSHSLDLKRRLNFKPDFKEDFQSMLCDPKLSVKGKLFGPDEILPDKIKDVSETLKLTNKINKQARARPYPSFSKQSKNFNRPRQGGMNKGKKHFTQKRNNFQRQNHQTQDYAPQKFKNKNQERK